MTDVKADAQAAALFGPLTPRAYLDLLKRVTGSRTVAYFIVSDGQSEKCVFLPAGGLRLSSVGLRRGRTAVEALLAHPKVTPEQRRRVERARAKVAEARARGELADADDLSASGDGEVDRRRANELEEVLGDHELRPLYNECCRAVVRDELIDMLLWDGAEFELRETNPPPKLFSAELEATKLSLGVKDVLEEVQKLGLEWQKLAQRLGQPSRTILRPTPAPPRPLPPVEAAVDAALKGKPDGDCTLEDAVIAGRRAGGDAIAVCHAIEALERQGVLKIDPKPPPPTPEQRRRRTLSELEKIEKAIQAMIQQLVARKRLAQCFEQLGDAPKAVENWRIVGEELVAARRQSEAIDVYRNVVRLAPEAYFARERIAGLYEQLGRAAEAAREWLDLSRLFAGLRLFNRAQASMRRVVQLAPDDLDHRRRLIDLLEVQGRRDEAAREYEDLARRYEAAGREEEALACFQRLAALAPDHPVARERLTRAARRVAPFVAPFAAIGLALLVVLVAAGWVQRRHQALEAFAAARARAVEHARGRRYVEARATLDEFEASTEFEPERVQRVRTLVDTIMADDARARLGRAHGLAAEQRVAEARALYREVEATFAGTPFAEQAADRLRAYLADEAAAASEVDAIAELVRANKLAAALERGRELMRTRGWTEPASRLALAVEVRSTPPAALITVDGQHTGASTPHVLSRPATPPVALRLALDGYEPRTTTVDLLSPDLTTPLTIELQRAPRWRLDALAPLPSAPFVDAEGLVVSGAERHVYGLGWDGKERWRAPMALFAAAAGTPVVLGERVIVVEDLGPGHARARSFDRRTGAEQGASDLAGDDVQLVGALAGGALVSARQGLTLLDDGAQARWSVPLPEPLAAPAEVAGERAFAPTVDGKVLVVGQDGSVEGALQVGGRPCARPVVTPSGCLVGTEAGDLAVVWRGVLWTRRLPAPLSASPLVADGVVYAPAGQRLVALDLRDGTPRWERELPASLGTPAHRGGRLYVGGADGAVHALVAQTGEPRWVFRTGGPVRAAPVVQRGMVFIASEDGTLYAVPD